MSACVEHLAHVGVAGRWLVRGGGIIWVVLLIKSPRCSQS